MSDAPFIGEIKIFCGNFAMVGHAFCAGQLIAISQNSALFSLIGTTYGGDGVNTFGLPDLRGRVPVHMGTGNGLSTRVIGQVSGTENVTLISSQLPVHTHSLSANVATGNSTNPAGNFWAAQPALTQYAAAPTGASNMKANAITNAGGNQPHYNMGDYIVVNYVIATEGLFPSRN